MLSTIHWALIVQESILYAIVFLGNGTSRLPKFNIQVHILLLSTCSFPFSFFLLNCHNRTLIILVILLTNCSTFTVLATWSVHYFHVRVILRCTAPFSSILLCYSDSFWTTLTCLQIMAIVLVQQYNTTKTYQTKKSIHKW